MKNLFRSKAQRIILVDDSGRTDGAGLDFFARVVSALGDAPGDVHAFCGQRSPDLCDIFDTLAGRSSGAHVAVVLNGRDGVHFPGPVAEMAAARFLAANDKAALDFLHVYTERNRRLREMAESISNVHPARRALLFVQVPDTTGVGAALKTKLPGWI